jgi:hypothetical protein
MRLLSGLLAITMPSTFPPTDAECSRPFTQ